LPATMCTPYHFAHTAGLRTAPRFAFCLYAARTCSLQFCTHADCLFWFCYSHTVYRTAFGLPPLVPFHTFWTYISCIPHAFCVQVQVHSFSFLLVYLPFAAHCTYWTGHICHTYTSHAVAVLLGFTVQYAHGLPLVSVCLFHCTPFILDAIRMLGCTLPRLHCLPLWLPGCRFTHRFSVRFVTVVYRFYTGFLPPRYYLVRSHTRHTPRTTLPAPVGLRLATLRHFPHGRCGLHTYRTTRLRFTPFLRTTVSPYTLDAPARSYRWTSTFTTRVCTRFLLPGGSTRCLRTVGSGWVCLGFTACVSRVYAYAAGSGHRFTAMPFFSVCYMPPFSTLPGLHFTSLTAAFRPRLADCLTPVYTVYHFRFYLSPRFTLHVWGSPFTHLPHLVWTHATFYHVCPFTPDAATPRFRNILVTPPLHTWLRTPRATLLLRPFVVYAFFTPDSTTPTPTFTFCLHTDVASFTPHRTRLPDTGLRLQPLVHWLVSIHIRARRTFSSWFILFWTFARTLPLYLPVLYTACFTFYRFTRSRIRLRCHLRLVYAAFHRQLRTVEHTRGLPRSTLHAPRTLPFQFIFALLDCLIAHATTAQVYTLGSAYAFHTVRCYFSLFTHTALGGTRTLPLHTTPHRHRHATTRGTAAVWTHTTHNNIRTCVLATQLPHLHTPPHWVWTTRTHRRFLLPVPLHRLPSPHLVTVTILDTRVHLHTRFTTFHTFPGCSSRDTACFFTCLRTRIRHPDRRCGTTVRINTLGSARTLTVLPSSYLRTALVASLL